MAFADARDVDGPFLRVAGTLGGGHDDGGRAVAFEAAVEESQRIGDHPRLLMILEGDRLRHHRVAVEPGVAAGRHRDLAELARGRAVELHVPPRHRRIELGGRNGADGHLELADHPELRHLPDSRSDPALGGPVASERDQDVPADAGAEDGDRTLHGRDRARAAHRRRRGEAEVGNAEVRDEVLGHDPAGGVRDDPVDVFGSEPGVGDGGQRRFHLESDDASPGIPAVPRLAHAGDRTSISQ